MDANMIRAKNWSLQGNKNTDINKIILENRKSVSVKDNTVARRLTKPNIVQFESFKIDKLE